MTNSPEAARRLTKQCTNGIAGEPKHQHAKLEGGKRCKQAQVFPRVFCRAVCDAIAAQQLADVMNVVSLDVMSLEEINSVGGDNLHEPEGSTVEYTATDDVTGGPLEPSKVIAARQEEMDYFKNMQVYEYSTNADCKAATGKSPIGVRWIDINKGDSQATNYRSRLVAK